MPPGNLYGTTFYGGFYGTYGPGTVFRVSHHGSGWTLTSLYEFHGHADGSNPWGGVIFGPDGALYGTTSLGGANGAGLVFKLQPPAAACRTAPCFWQETVLYSFTDGSMAASRKAIWPSTAPAILRHHVLWRSR